MSYGSYGPLNYGQPAPSQGPAATPHAGVGIASFVIALVVGLGEMALVVAAGLLAMRGTGDDDPAAVALGLLMGGGLVGAIAGLALGIAGLIQRNRKRLFAVLGLVFNGLILLALGGLMIIGLSS